MAGIPDTSVSSAGNSGPWWRLVKFGFRLLYNEMAFTYDVVSQIVSLGEWRTWQRAALRHLNVAPPARVLELAHGTANLQIDLRMMGFNSAGIDLSRAMGRIARRKHMAHGLVPRLAGARAEALPFASGVFRGVVATFPTEFIMHPATLSEVARVLVPGGRLVIVPGAQITRGGLAGQGLELAYRVTGQRGPYPPGVEERFTDAGFRLSTAIEPAKRSVAQVVIAERP